MKSLEGSIIESAEMKCLRYVSLQGFDLKICEYKVKWFEHIRPKEPERIAQCIMNCKPKGK
jgi:hypothetical protein